MIYYAIQIKLDTEDREVLKEISRAGRMLAEYIAFNGDKNGRVIVTANGQVYDEWTLTAEGEEV